MRRQTERKSDTVCLGGKKEFVWYREQWEFCWQDWFAVFYFYFFSIAVVIKEPETAITSDFTVPVWMMGNLTVTPDFFLLLLCAPHPWYEWISYRSDLKITYSSCINFLQMPLKIGNYWFILKSVKFRGYLLENEHGKEKKQCQPYFPLLYTAIWYHLQSKDAVINRPAVFAWSLVSCKICNRAIMAFVNK